MMQWVLIFLSLNTPTFAVVYPDQDTCQQGASRFLATPSKPPNLRTVCVKLHVPSEDGG